MTATAHNLALLLAVLSFVAQAGQNCQGNECPVAVNSLLQSGRKASSAALAQQVDNAPAQLGTPSGYTKHTGLECGWEIGKSASAKGLTNPKTIVGTVAQGAAACNAQPNCVGFVASSTKVFLKSSLDHNSCAGGSTNYDSYLKNAAVSTSQAQKCRPPGIPHYPEVACPAGEVCTGYEITVKMGECTTAETCRPEKKCPSCQTCTGYQAGVSMGTCSTTAAPCNVVASDSKCGASRVFKSTGVATVDMCYQECLSNGPCKFFSFGSASSSHPGDCHGCATLANNMDSHDGFTAYNLR